MVRNEKGFTLIEIIIVLVVLVILAAIAVPRYINMANQAKISVAKAQVAQIKSTLDLVCVKMFIINGSAPTRASSVIVNAGFTSGKDSDIGIAPDIWNVTLKAKGAGTSATIDINDYNGDARYTASGTWNIP